MDKRLVNVKWLCFVPVLFLCACGAFQAPPRAEIVKPALERVERRIEAVEAATGAVTVKAEEVHREAPTEATGALVELAKDAELKAEEAKAEFTKAKERAEVIEEQLGAMEDRVFEVTKEVGKLKTKVANWRLTAFSAIFAFVVATTLLLKPWRWL